jgi:hypothetical protein
VTKTVKFKGKVRWAKVWPAQLDTKFKTEARGGSWSVVLNLPEDQVKTYNALGLKNPAKTEEDVMIAKIKAKKKAAEKGVEYRDPDMQVNDVSFHRYERHPKTGELGAPKIIGVEEGTSIGNDSLCEVTAEIYPYTFEGQNGNASRLVSLKVIDLVPYEKDDGAPI